MTTRVELQRRREARAARQQERDDAQIEALARAVLERPDLATRRSTVIFAEAVLALLAERDALLDPPSYAQRVAARDEELLRRLETELKEEE